MKHKYEIFYFIKENSTWSNATWYTLLIKNADTECIWYNAIKHNVVCSAEQLGLIFQPWNFQTISEVVYAARYSVIVKSLFYLLKKGAKCHKIIYYLFT